MERSSQVWRWVRIAGQIVAFASFNVSIANVCFAEIVTGSYQGPFNGAGSDEEFAEARFGAPPHPRPRGIKEDGLTFFSSENYSARNRKPAGLEITTDKKQDPSLPNTPKKEGPPTLVRRETASTEQSQQTQQTQHTEEAPQTLQHSQTQHTEEAPQTLQHSQIQRAQETPPTLQHPQTQQEQAPLSTLTPFSSSRSGVQEISLIAGELGYFPKTIFVTRDIPVKLFVTGASKRPLCIMLDHFQVRKQVRSQRIEEIDFIPTTSGQFRFYCPVNGMEGTLFVRDSVGESDSIAHSRGIVSSNLLEGK